jgi:hypothetical protein
MLSGQTTATSRICPHPSLGPADVAVRAWPLALELALPSPGPAPSGVQRKAACQPSAPRAAFCAPACKEEATPLSHMYPRPLSALSVQGQSFWAPACHEEAQAVVRLALTLFSRPGRLGQGGAHPPGSRAHASRSGKSKCGDGLAWRGAILCAQRTDRSREQDYPARGDPFPAAGLAQRTPARPLAAHPLSPQPKLRSPARHGPLKTCPPFARHWESALPFPPGAYHPSPLSAAGDAQAPLAAP